jgi:hypothetical protein
MSARAASLRPSRSAPETPPPEAVPVVAPAAPRAWKRMAAVCLLLAALAAGAWALVGLRADAQAPAPPAAQVASLGSTSVHVPADWARADASESGLSGLPADARVFAPTPGLSAHAVVVLVPGALPAWLRALAAGPNGGRATTLAGHPAGRFPIRAIGGDRMAQLTISRTGAGTLAVACVARGAAWTGAADCAQQVDAAGG